jgi:hypothetical protein
MIVAMAALAAGPSLLTLSTLPDDIILRIAAWLVPFVKWLRYFGKASRNLRRVLQKSKAGQRLIKQLDFSGTNIREIDLYMMIYECPHLQFLNVERCPNIYHYSLREMKSIVKRKHGTRRHLVICRTKKPPKNNYMRDIELNFNMCDFSSSMSSSMS